MESDPLIPPPTKDDLPATPQDVVQPLTLAAIFMVLTLNPGALVATPSDRSAATFPRCCAPSVSAISGETLPA